MPLLPGDRVDGGLLPGYVADTVRNTQVTGITTVETSIQSVTFTAVSGARYRIMAAQSIQTAVTGDLVQVRIRYTPGATPSSPANGGIELVTTLHNVDVAARGQVVTFWAYFQGSGQITAYVTVVRTSGTGVVTSNGSPTQHNLLSVEAV